MPTARSIGEVVADKYISDELANGAFLVSVPFTENDTRVVAANISL